MKIPPDAVIPADKLLLYLLLPRDRNDKSGYLAQAGFTLENADELEYAIRRLISEHEAISDRNNEYGVFYRVVGDLQGPAGSLPVVTVWLRRNVDESFRFVTLKPIR